MSTFTIGMILILIGSLFLLGIVIKYHFSLVERTRRIYYKTLEALSREPENKRFEQRARELGRSYYRLTMTENYSAMDHHLIVNPTTIQSGDDKVEEDIERIQKDHFLNKNKMPKAA